jgi:hypothetical protein
MVHTTTRSPLSGTIAVIAAGAVVLAGTTIEPPKPPVALTAPTISTQAVHLTALAGPLQAAGAADVSADLANVGEVLQGIPTAIGQAVQGVIAAPLAGAVAGVVFGFIGGGLLAGQLLSWVPEGLRFVVSPVVPAVALLGAIIGAPIGAVVGPIIAAANWLSGILSPPNAVAAALSSPAPTAFARVPAASRRTAANTPHRTTRPGVRPNRSIAKPSASSAGKDAPSAPLANKDAVPQQHSKATRNETGHARGTAAKRPAQH